MNTYESLGYLKGLMDGLEIDENSKEGKIFKAITAVLDNLAEDVEDLIDEVDDLEDDVCDLEDYVYDEDDEYWDDDEEFEEYAVECPNCGESLEFEFEEEDEEDDEE